ncbi:MAG: serine hydrolase [Gammaproteobacteria bacterium]
MTRILVVLFVSAGLACAGAGEDDAAQAGTPPSVEPLRNHVQALASRIRGEVGVTIRHIETGEGFHLNGDRQYPTASIYKLPIMVEAFRQAEEGTLRLQERVTIEPEMLHFSRILARFEPGLNPTFKDLIYWMITESENGATDIVLERVGAEDVTGTMRSLGLKSITVSRTVKLMMADYTGIYDEAQRSLTGPAFQQMYQSRPAAAYYGRMWREPDLAIPESVKKFNNDGMDHASPNDLASLQEMIFRGKVVSPEASRRMIDIMLETTFAPDLIPGLLPPGTRVARKAGTLPTSLGETGIIYLPDGKGHVIVTVMNRNLRETRQDGARFIARVARAAYDHFTTGTLSDTTP